MSADAPYQHVEQAGTSTQGTSTQGTSTQGTSTQAAGLEAVSVTGATKNGVALTGVWVDNGQLRAAGHSGDQLIGAVFNGRNGYGNPVKLKIDDHFLDVPASGASPNMIAADDPTTTEDDRNNADVHLYKVSYQSGTLLTKAGPVPIWSPLCNKKYVPGSTTETYDSAAAVILPGVWLIENGQYLSGSSNFTIGCWQGTIGKCVRWGYKPWKSMRSPITGETISLANLHRACVRGAMADYCGDGKSRTLDGTPVDVYDRYGFIQKVAEWNSSALAFSEEAAFGVDGSRCIERARYEEIGDDGCADVPMFSDVDASDPIYHKPRLNPVSFRSGDRDLCQGGIESQPILFDTSTYCHSPFSTGEPMPADCSACTTDVCDALEKCCDTNDPSDPGDTVGAWDSDCTDEAAATLTCGAPLPPFTPYTPGR